MFHRFTNSLAVCNPACSNGGLCIFHNTCQCPQNFAGPQCQYSIDRCSPKNIGFNGGVQCTGTSTGLSCTLNCPLGIKFESPPAAAYTCTFQSGKFTPAIAPKCAYGGFRNSSFQFSHKLTFFSKGEGVQVSQRFAVGSTPQLQGFPTNPFKPTCNPKCANGGSCVFLNMCQCTKNFRGPQCQYSVDRCSLKNTEFNGGFRCSGSATELSCILICPDGVDYEFPPASVYVCNYETGRFSPSPIPKCVFGEGVEVIRRITSN